MDPNKPQYSIDYLNQIAPKQPRPVMDNKFFFGVMALGLVMVIGFAIFLISGAGGTSQTTRLQTMAARFDALQKISDNAGQNITDNHLQTINANLDIQLTNVNQNIVAPLASSGVDAKNIPDNIKAQESLSDLTNKLEDAKLNAVYDRVYAKDINYQLQSLFILMREIDTGSSNQSLHKFTQETTGNLEPLAEQLANFTDAND